jgi:hypothetical protein
MLTTQRQAAPPACFFLYVGDGAARHLHHSTLMRQHRARAKFELFIQANNQDRLIHTRHFRPRNGAAPRSPPPVFALITNISDHVARLADRSDLLLKSPRIGGIKRESAIA